MHSNVDLFQRSSVMPAEYESTALDQNLDPEKLLALLRRMTLTESDCYGCVDWYHFEPLPPEKTQ